MFTIVDQILSQIESLSPSNRIELLKNFIKDCTFSITENFSTNGLIKPISPHDDIKEHNEGVKSYRLTTFLTPEIISGQIRVLTEESRASLFKQLKKNYGDRIPNNKRVVNIMELNGIINFINGKIKERGLYNGACTINIFEKYGFIDGSIYNNIELVIHEFESAGWKINMFYEQRFYNDHIDGAGSGYFKTLSYLVLNI